MAQQIESNTDQPAENKKRTYMQLRAEDIMSKLRSKSDFYWYMDQQRKCPAILILCFI